jgi:hypothetical protein
MDEALYAVAVKDGADLFLFCRVRRNKKGELFVAIPRYGVPGWGPHSSYHANGRYHVKTHNRAHHPRCLQKPDANFKGIENLATLGIAAHEPRETNAPCKVNSFREIFEIPVSELRPEEYRTHLAVDAAEPGVQPGLFQGAEILRRATFKDAIPWIVITLYDTHLTAAQEPISTL